MKVDQYACYGKRVEALSAAAASYSPRAPTLLQVHNNDCNYICCWPVRAAALH